MAHRYTWAVNRPMPDEHPTIHPVVIAALVMTGIVLLGLMLVLWPLLVASPPADAPGPPAAVAVEPVEPPSEPASPAVQSPVHAPPMEPAEPRIEQGVKLAFESADGATRDARRARLIALHVPSGESPTPFLAPGTFTATWTGNLNVELRDRFVFTFEGTGEFELTIDGQPILGAGERTSKRIRLSQGATPVTARYRSPKEGPAQVRLLWQGSDFPMEPIPPTALSFDASDVEVRTGERLRHGRQLVATGRCLRCHAPTGAVAQDLVRDAPALLGGLGESWVRHWLMAPKAIRPAAQMPRLVHEPQDAADIAAFLESFAPARPADSPAPPSPELADRGGHLYLALGCASCHGQPGETEEQNAHVPLDGLGEKYTSRSSSLRQYLAQPASGYLWARMPDFALSEEEISALAAYLKSATAESNIAPAQSFNTLSGIAADPERGRRLVQALGCASCHAGLPAGGSTDVPSYAQLQRSDWSRGCVAAEGADRGRAPDFDYSVEDREALLAFIQSDQQALGRFVPTEFAARQIEELRCTACHRYDGGLDDWSRVAPHPPATTQAGAEAHIDQTRPMLTFAGEKLKTHYLEQIIGGELDRKPRPWMEARMPSFGLRADWLAQGLAMMHGYPPEDGGAEHLVAPLAEAGEKLIGKQWGFGCTDCHGLGDLPPQAVFEAQGINLADVPQRLRYDWYLRWMLHPPRIEPATKMPRYADDRGQTQLNDVLGGQGEEQFQAIWSYLQQLR